MDTVLAQRVVELEKELKRIEHESRAVEIDKHLLPATKQKLLQHHCESKARTEKLLETQKQELAEYLDQQTVVNSKQHSR